MHAKSHTTKNSAEQPLQIPWEKFLKNYVALAMMWESDGGDCECHGLSKKPVHRPDSSKTCSKDDMAWYSHADPFCSSIPFAPSGRVWNTTNKGSHSRIPPQGGLPTTNLDLLALTSSPYHLSLTNSTNLLGLPQWRFLSCCWERGPWAQEKFAQSVDHFLNLPLPVSIWNKL